VQQPRRIRRQGGRLDAPEELKRRPLRRLPKMRGEQRMGKGENVAANKSKRWKPAVKRKRKSGGPRDVNRGPGRKPRERRPRQGRQSESKEGGPGELRGGQLRLMENLWLKTLSD
jgi:hypothetical protein